MPTLCNNGKSKNAFLFPLLNYEIVFLNQRVSVLLSLLLKMTYCKIYFIYLLLINYIDLVVRKMCFLKKMFFTFY